MILEEPRPLRFDAQGLIPVVAQDLLSGAVLMVAYMNSDSLRLTRETGEAHFWSRSRRCLWHKGATSGHRLLVRQLQSDCDGDALLLGVLATGPACHLGRRACFPEPAAVMDRLRVTLEQRQVTRPQGSYTAHLLAGGAELVARKVGEEAVEVILAALAEDPAALRREVADLWYHTAVLLMSRGLDLEAVLAELRERAERQALPGGG
ncbi:MAG: bifunctional phosphoribosyl-AMP cyclohydrolase/phosphoribosyl-ATP diphosphatase HisIE [Candidatus Dormiibacterota bacterium]